MAIFGCENAAKRFLFSKSTLKTRKKIVMESFFSSSYRVQLWGQKWTHTKIDHFTKNGPKSSKLGIFHRVLFGLFRPKNIYFLKLSLQIRIPRLILPFIRIGSIKIFPRSENMESIPNICKS
jgi:hypothetical protein